MNTPKHMQLHKNRLAGFTLVEIAIVVVIIGILAALAIPAFKKSRDSAKISAFENDLRIYEQDFETFELENKFFPPSQPIAGQLPVGMEDRMRDTWKLRSPIGGTYRWVYTTEDNPSERSAYIEILNSGDHPISISLDRLKEIDDDLDDGNPATGHIRLTGLNIRYYVRL